jgi:hypothetical protein
MACTGETAGGMELVEIQTPARPVELGEPDMERKAHYPTKANANAFLPPTVLRNGIVGVRFYQGVRERGLTVSWGRGRRVGELKGGRQRKPASCIAGCHPLKPQPVF